MEGSIILEGIDVEGSGEDEAVGLSLLLLLAVTSSEGAGVVIQEGNTAEGEAVVVGEEEFGFCGLILLLLLLE